MRGLRSVSARFTERSGFSGLKNARMWITLRSYPQKHTVEVRGLRSRGARFTERECLEVRGLRRGARGLRSAKPICARFTERTREVYGA